MTAVLVISRSARSCTSRGRGSSSGCGYDGCPVIPHRYSRSTRMASHRRNTRPTLARLRTSSRLTLIGMRGSAASSSAEGLAATSSAVVRAGHWCDGGGGSPWNSETSVLLTQHSAHDCLVQLVLAGSGGAVALRVAGVGVEDAVDRRRYGLEWLCKLAES